VFCIESVLLLTKLRIVKISQETYFFILLNILNNVEGNGLDSSGSG
jgi:hypothetical protein